MNIIVNGEERTFDEATTLEAMLKALSLEGKVMAAAVNMNIVKQEAWHSHVLRENDRIELLDFVGGG